MDNERLRRVLELHARRGDVEHLAHVGRPAARACLDRARGRLAAAQVLIDAGHADSAFTTAYDAYRMAAEAIVLDASYRVPAVWGAHRITFEIAHAALHDDSEFFETVRADRFRSGRHDSEYFDPDHVTEKSRDDAEWAVASAAAAVAAVESALA